MIRNIFETIAKSKFKQTVRMNPFITECLKSDYPNNKRSRKATLSWVPGYQGGKEIRLGKQATNGFAESPFAGVKEEF